MSDDEEVTTVFKNINSGKRKGKKRKEHYESEKLNNNEERNNGEKLECASDYDENNGGEDSDIGTYGVSDSENSKGSMHKAKRNKLIGPLKLHFNCEWKNCGYETEEEANFHVHVSCHIPDVEIKTLANGDEMYMCLWAECSYLTGGASDIQRHVTYHSYHTKLKSIGSKIIEEWKIPKCTYGNETRNLVPEKIDPMVCEWKDCGRTNKEFNNIQVFLHHIQMHVNENFNEPWTKRETIKCKWDGCTMKREFEERARLTQHLRTHTLEKAMSCPTCGHLFASSTKLVDHCERQLPQELSEFQCSTCYKHYPSLRLLKTHMRGHINFFKCCYCDMTCTNRHTYSAHIRYKHLDCKAFKCNMCDYTCKTQYDLKSHLTSHDPKPQFECEETGCEFSCRTKHTLQRHMIDDHQVASCPVYACHLPGCQSSYKRGCYLTKHLINKHCLRWPSGHSKFMYHREQDGIYRLQTVRYESGTLYGENNKSLAMPMERKFKVTNKSADGSRSFEVSHVDSETESNSSQVLISIEDESGKTINNYTAPEVVGDKIPKNATVIACAESDD